jgi:hypothetical protein
VREVRNGKVASCEVWMELVCGNRWVANTECSQGREFGSFETVSILCWVLLSVEGRCGAAAVMSASAGERRLDACIYDETRKLETGSLLVVPTYRNSRQRGGVKPVSVSGSREQGEARHLKALGVGGVWRASRPNVGCVIAFMVSQPMRPCTALHVLRRATLLRQPIYNYDKCLAVSSSLTSGGSSVTVALAMPGIGVYIAALVPHQAC